MLISGSGWLSNNGDTQSMTSFWLPTQAMARRKRSSALSPRKRKTLGAGTRSSWWRQSSSAITTCQVHADSVPTPTLCRGSASPLFSRASLCVTSPPAPRRLLHPAPFVLRHLGADTVVV
jgi:hypothetical protein